jgi:hypothetical protein
MHQDAGALITKKNCIREELKIFNSNALMQYSTADISGRTVFRD